MNTLYLILIGLGFSAGVITTALKSEENIQSSTICTDNTNECIKETKVLSEPETKSLDLLNIIN